MATKKANAKKNEQAKPYFVEETAKDVYRVARTLPNGKEHIIDYYESEKDAKRAAEILNADLDNSKSE